MLKEQIFLNNNYYIAPIYDYMKAYENQGDLKRSQFRKQIRKKQIQDYFEHQRFKHALIVFQEQQQDISQHMRSQQSKRQWLNFKSIQLGTIPKRQWFPLLKQLYIAADSFNSDLEDWMRTGLIKCLTLLLQPKYRELQLFHLSACILQQIIRYLTHQSSYISEIVTEETAIDLVDLCQLPQYNFFSLINTIICKKLSLRNLFIKCGLIQSLVSNLKSQKNIENQQTYIILNVLYHTIKQNSHPSIMNIFENNLLLVELISILGKFTIQVKNRNTLRILLKILDCLANTSKQPIVQNIIDYDSLLDILLDLLAGESDSMIRSLLSHILLNFSSFNNFAYIQNMLEKKILNKILRCSLYEDNNEECMRNLLKIISNIAQNSFEDSRHILYHNVFQQFVLKCAKKARSKNHADAIYPIYNIIKHNSMEMIQILIKKHQILSIFTQCLKSYAIQINCITEILKSVIQIILLYKEQNKNGQKKIISQLENIYNFTHVLEILQENIKNQEVEELISIIFQFIHGQ